MPASFPVVIRRFKPDGNDHRFWSETYQAGSRRFGRLTPSLPPSSISAATAGQGTLRPLILETLPKRRPSNRLLACALWFACALPLLAQERFGFSEMREFLDGHCLACHQGESAAAGLRIDELVQDGSFRERPDAWLKLSVRVASGEMPPRGGVQPTTDARIAFVDWIERSWREHACQAALPLPRSLFRRLNRDEYSATIRDLFDIQIDVSERFPVDGAGGEGFDNAAETLFVSPLLAEKYLETATLVVDVASKEFKSRSKIFVVHPGEGVTEQAAARQILAEFLPRVFRRPVSAAEIESYARLVQRVRRKGLDFEPAIFAALRSALVSPSFLFHVIAGPDPAEFRQYALASRLSYFLWGSMPDELLIDVAAAGRMGDPEVLARLVPRMLRDPRALEFFSRFTEQWLRVRELEGAHGPDPVLFPEYHADAELRGDIRLQPVFFFREVFRGNRSLLEFLDSRATILTQGLIDHLELPMKKKQDSKNPNWMALPEGSGRGGLLGMPAVAALASHPHRTSRCCAAPGFWMRSSAPHPHLRRRMCRNSKKRLLGANCSPYGRSWQCTAGSRHAQAVTLESTPSVSRWRTTACSGAGGTRTATFP